MSENTNLYFIQSIEHQFAGMHVVWWKPNRLGYTISLDEAGVYTEGEVAEILVRANYRGVINERAWKMTDVLRGKAGKLARVVMLP